MALTAKIEKQISTLSAQRRKIVEDALNEMAEELLERTADSSELSRAAAAGRAAVDATGILMTGKGAEIARVAEVLAAIRDERSTEAREEPSLEKLEAWGRLQLLSLYRSIEEDSIKVADLEREGISRQRLGQLRNQERLLGIDLPFQRGFVYPKWQFERDMRPKAFLSKLISAARAEGLDGVSLHQLMTNPSAGERPGETLVSACDRGETDLALNAIRTFGESGG
jgi:hypothetical protein